MTPSHRRRPAPADAGEATGALARGREAYARREWRDAYEQLSRADEAAPLGGDDLERLAWSAALLGRDDAMLSVMERTWQAHLDAGRTLRAARLAFWIGFRLFGLGEHGRAGGWLGRSAQLVEREGGDTPERGYLLLPEAHRRLGSGDPDGAREIAHEAAETGDRLGDVDLATLARSIEGRALLRMGRHDEGLAVLDLAMLPATRDGLSPVVTGLVYCSVIDCCRSVYALARAQEWTAVLAEWCDAQPQLATFTGTCRVHRSEILQLRGDWPAATDEVRRAVERFSGYDAADAAGATLYQKAELHRLRGEHAEAEEAYREASRHGREPQPGLALLRLAQGKLDAAAAAIRQVTAATEDPLARTRFLPAAVEILLAAGDREGARAAAADLEAIAGPVRNEVLDAMAAHARGALRLADGDPRGAVEPLRAAFATWQHVGAPYLAARVRVLIGGACRQLGDADGAGLEHDAARAVFRDLGAATDLARVDALAGDAARERPFGLTPRELEVLRLVASGKTNRAISEALHLSEKTVDRHVSNIFNKLDVSTRAAATAFAYRHRLV